MRKFSKSLLFYLFMATVYIAGCGFKSGDKSIQFRNGTLKIMQLTDVHYESGTEESAKALARMEHVIDQEHPDLVIFTGDIVLGPKQELGWHDILTVLNSRNLPWAMVLGNHDDEFTDWSRQQIMEYITPMRGSLIDKSAKGVTGYCNYTITIKDEKGQPAAVLYLMDSNNYSTIEKIRGYGWFEFDQVDWYRRTSARYTHLNHGKPLPAFAFFHIPLQEYRQATNQKGAKVVGTKSETECCGVINTGMYAAMLKAGDVMSTFVGHDHNNDYICSLNGIGLAYGRFSGSKMTYTDIGYGARIIVMKQGERAFDTWIRTSDGEQLYKIHFPDDLEAI